MRLINVNNVPARDFAKILENLIIIILLEVHLLVKEPNLK